MSLSGLCGLALAGCPFFTEIFPDPSEVEDSRGEFIEVRLAPDSLKSGTLSVFFEDKLIYTHTPAAGESRLLIHRDTLACPDFPELACGLLSGPALPNSRESRLRLTYGTCADSSLVPAPKPGLSLQRSDSDSSWSLAEPTPGYANPDFEKGVRDCRAELVRAEITPGGWNVRLALPGCDSARASVVFTPLDVLSGASAETVLLRGETDVPFAHADAAVLKVTLERDDYPLNDTLDTLLAVPGASPVFFTEIHPCPAEPVPEWAEIYNAGARPFPLADLNFCGRGTVAALPADSLGPRGTLVLAKDTAAFREWLGFNDARVAKANFGYLKNSADTLLLCLKNVKLDSVAWGKPAGFVPACPDGFGARTRRAENSPGFQTPASLNAAHAATGELPFVPKWNSRVVSRSGGVPLMVSAVSEVPVRVELLSGSGILLWHSDLKAGEGDAWVEVPLASKGVLGPNFLRFSEGRYEKLVGVILRP